MGVQIRCWYCRQGEVLRIGWGAVRTERMNPDLYHRLPYWVDKRVAEKELRFELELQKGKTYVMNMYVQSLRIRISPGFLIM